MAKPQLRSRFVRAMINQDIHGSGVAASFPGGIDTQVFSEIPVCKWLGSPGFIKQWSSPISEGVPQPNPYWDVHGT